jgi:hypothetical protein
MSSIIAINQKHITDPRLDTVLGFINQIDRRMLAYFSQPMPTLLGLMNRAGENVFPFNSDILPSIDSVMPTYDPNFNLSWDEVTDRRAVEIEQLIQIENKKLVVFWSGGIDSTCIVTAILKNFSTANLSQVSIACTAESILENPVFYNKYIVPNFNTVNTNYYVNHNMINSADTLLVEGFGADTLTMSVAPSLDVCMSVRNGQMLLQDWRTQPDNLIQYLSLVTKSTEFAKWYYEKNFNNITSVNVPIETYFDFMWWFGFNYDYYNWALHAWFFYYRHLNIPYTQFKSICVGWYRTDEYQLWAMKNNGALVKHGIGPGSFKRHPKQYIYNYDSNECYYRYKTKINSNGRNQNSNCQKEFAITDQFEILFLEKDLDRIIELLPTHIKS